MLIACSRKVGARPRTVFACVDQPEHILGWVGGIVEHAYLTERTPTSAVGQHFRQRLRQGKQLRTFDGEIIAWEPACHFGLRIPSAAYTSEAHFRISADGPDCSTVDYSIEIALHERRARFLAGLMRIPLGIFVRRQIDRLKTYAEQLEDLGVHPV